MLRDTQVKLLYGLVAPDEARPCCLALSLSAREHIMYRWLGSTIFIYGRVATRDEKLL